MSPDMLLGRSESAAGLLSWLIPMIMNDDLTFAIFRRGCTVQTFVSSTFAILAESANQFAAVVLCLTRDRAVWTFGNAVW